MSEGRLSQYSMRLFIQALADVLSDFEKAPLDDRDACWFFRHLKARIEVDLLRFDIAEQHKRSLASIWHRLDWLLILLDLQVRDGEWRW